MKSLATLLVTSVMGASYDYKQNGADWPELQIDGNKCGHNFQSPIDLPSEVDDEYYLYQSRSDNFQKIYSNVKNARVNWNGHTSQVNVNEQDELQFFNSEFVLDRVGGSDRFKGV